MRFEVYCDESHPDLLGSKHPPADFMVIGSLWLTAASRAAFKRDIHGLRDKHKIGGEFKWQKTSSESRQSFYHELVNWFFDQGDQLCFRCIAVEREQVNLVRYHESDQELGFYKFYYQLLHHWILDRNEYAVFCDFKSNRRRDRLQVLRRCLEASNLSSRILRVQAVRSKESVLLQLVDVLTGAVAATLNHGSVSSAAKLRLIEEIEMRLGKPLGHTVKAEQKLNIFVIDLQGGW